MKPGAPSRTAHAAALYRAAHQLVDRPPVLVDPLALRVVGSAAEAALRAGRAPWTSAEAASLRAFVAVRSRCAEDGFAVAHARGVRQHVAVGAGLDTFAYRSPFSDVRFVEVDHPATQAWKRERLALGGIEIPSAVTLAPVDLEREGLLAGLARCGLDLARPAYFAWLGVTPYLTREAVMSTLAQIALGAAPGSEVVFDFASPAPGDPAALGARSAFAGRVERIGEPVRCLLRAPELREALRPLGFTQLETLETADLNQRYFAARQDGLRLRAGQLLRARTATSA